MHKITLRLICKLLTSAIDSLEELHFVAIPADSRFIENRKKLLAIRAAIQEIGDE